MRSPLYASTFASFRARHISNQLQIQKVRKGLRIL